MTRRLKIKLSWYHYLILGIVGVPVSMTIAGLILGVLVGNPNLPDGNMIRNPNTFDTSIP